MSIGVLVVDPFEPWRRFLVLILKDNSSLQIVGAVSNGLEAVQKAQALQPDLVVMDVNIPKLNGIDTARRIRTVAPRCKILFLSRESDPDLARAAFREGASGYVLKESVVRDLALAVEIVVEGKRFVSHGLALYDITNTE